MTCEHCRTEYELEERLAGKLARCRECGRTFRIPGAKMESEKAIGFAPDMDESTIVGTPEASAPRPVRMPPPQRTAAPGMTPAIAPLGALEEHPEGAEGASPSMYYSLSRRRLEGPIGELVYIWLPRMLTVLSIIGIGAATALLTTNRYQGRPGIVAGIVVISAAVFMLFVVPICMLAVRIAERKYHFQLPPMTRWRLVIILLIPTAFAFLFYAYGGVWAAALAVPLGLFAAFFAFWILLNLRFESALRAYIAASIAYIAGAVVNAGAIWVMIQVVNQIQGVSSGQGG